MINLSKCFVCLIILFCVAVQISNASTCDQNQGTDIFGPVWQDTSWTKANSPYCITQNITVMENVTLTIESSVVIKFWEGTDQKLDDKFIITIDGELIARGTGSERIFFTSSRIEPEPGDWAYIQFTSKSKGAIFNDQGEYLEGSIMEYVTIEYGGGYYKAPVTEIKAPYFNYVTFQRNSNGAIEARDEYTKISNCSFVNNTNGRGGAIYAPSNSGTLEISDSTFIENSTPKGRGGAVSAYGPLIISKSEFKNNYSDGVGGAVHSNGPLNIKSSAFINNTSNLSGAGIYKYERSTAIIQDSVFTGNSSSSDQGGAGGIIDIGYGNVNISKCLVYDNQGPETITLRGSGGIHRSGIIHKSSIINNSGNGLKISGDLSLTITDSNIFGNQFYDVYSKTIKDIVAKNNYWGTEDPAEIFLNIYDKFDDRGRGEVDFGISDNSYLTSFAPNAPRIPFAIVNESIQDASINEYYEVTFQSEGGIAPYRWFIQNGSLPTGLTLDQNTGVISGFASEDGTFSFTIRLEDSSEVPNTATKSYTISVTSLLEEIDAFVARFYRLCLDREPDLNGLEGWVNALLDGSMTGSDVAYGFVFSNEFTGKSMTNEEYLMVLYEAFFNRPPDTEGRQGWLDAMENGATKKEVLNGFIYATEFTNLCESYGILAFKDNTPKTPKEYIEAFVTRFYQLCLDRDPDAAGLDGWADNLLNQIQTGADVANGFIYSQEFINKNTSNDEYLTILYKAFFNRDPDQAGWDVWLSELNSGKDRGYVLNGFLGSQEFINLCEDYGIVPF